MRAQTLAPSSRIGRRVFCAAVVALAATACSTTSLRDSWKDPAYTGGKFQQLLVLGVSKSDADRRVFEDAFTAALRGAGGAGAPSYTVLPQSGALTNVQLTQAMQQSKSDAVLVTRVLRVRRDVSVSPGYVSPGFYNRGFGGWYGSTWATSPDINVYDVMTVESTLWNASVDKPVWSATSEVTEPGSVAKATEDLAKVLIGKLKEDGMI